MVGPSTESLPSSIQEQAIIKHVPHERPFFPREAKNNLPIFVSDDFIFHIILSPSSYGRGQLKVVIRYFCRSPYG